MAGTGIPDLTAPTSSGGFGPYRPYTRQPARRPRYPRVPPIRLGGFSGGGYGYPRTPAAPPSSTAGPWGPFSPFSGGQPRITGYQGSARAPQQAGQPLPPLYTPQSDAALQAEATSYVNAQIAPLINEINRSIAARSASGAAAIDSATQALMGAYGQYAPQAGAAYGAAQKSTAAVEDALANRLTGQGNAVSADLAGALAAAGQDTSGAQGLAGVGAGAANAGLAQGAAALEALIAQGAAAQNYGAKLPGIGALQGRQATSEFQAQLNALLADQLGQVKAQVPGMAADELQRLQDREFNKQQASRSAYESARNFNEGVREFNLSRQPTPYQVAQDKAAKRRQRQADFQTMKHNNEVDTGYQWEITSTGVRPRLVNGQKVPTKASRDQNYQKAQTLAANRTNTTPWVWEATPDGKVRRVTDPKTGGPLLNPRTKAEQTRVKENADREATRVRENQQAVLRQKAAQRSADTGYEWEPRPDGKGIRPVKGPGGKYVPTSTAVTNAKNTRRANAATAKADMEQRRKEAQVRGELGKDGQLHYFQYEIVYKGEGPYRIAIGIRKATGADGKPIEFLPTAGKAPKASASVSKILHYLADENGHPILGADGKPIPIETTSAAPKPNQLDVTGSQKTGAWRWKGGRPLTPQEIAAYQLPPKPTAASSPKTAPKVNIPLSRQRGVWVDASGNPIPGSQAWPKPQPLPGTNPKATGAKDRQSAIKAATASAVRIVTSISKRTPVYKTTTTTDPISGAVKSNRRQVGTKLTGGYYEAIHKVESAVEPLLSPYMSRSQIIQFAQRIVNGYYEPGKGGRPNAAPALVTPAHGGAGPPAPKPVKAVYRNGQWTVGGKPAPDQNAAWNAWWGSRPKGREKERPHPGSVTTVGG